MVLPKIGKQQWVIYLNENQYGFGLRYFDLEVLGRYYYPPMPVMLSRNVDIDILLRWKR